MKKQHSIIIGTTILLLSAVVSFGEVKIVAEHNSGENATAQFKFKNIPAPAANDAGAKATLTVVAGDADSNSGEVSKLNDGKLPTEEDQPDENFFFGTESEGGRIQMDLGSVIAVKQVNTYSWHSNTRGPQVYKLYASDGAADGFKAKPETGVDPEKAGWKLIASVDTRPHDGDSGGQYGVSIADSNGVIGKYRYLLFNCSRTEADDTFGNTFYSEIDVVDAPGAMAGNAVATQVPLNLVFNTVGIYTNNAEFSDGLDGSGYACSAELLGASQVWNGVTFKIGSPGVSNAVTCAGQTVTLPAGNFSSLRILALGVNGNQEAQDFSVAYADGSHQKINQGVSDWFTPTSYPGESQVVTMDHRNNSDGTSSSDQTFYVYGYAFDLNKTNALKSITLPDNANVKVLAITLTP